MGKGEWSGGTIGVPLYISASTSGAFTETAPSGAGDVIRIIGYNIDDQGRIYFNPDNSYTTV